MFHLLYDLTATQPTPDSKFHGAGTYGEIVFLQLLTTFDRQNIMVSAAFDSSRYINQHLLDAALDAHVTCFDIQKYTPSQIIKEHEVDRLYSALLDEHIPWPLDDIEIITTVHGLRSLELLTDPIALTYETAVSSKLKQLLKNTLLKKKYFEKVYRGYRRFFTGRMKIVTVSHHSKASILSFFPAVRDTDIRVFSSPTFDQLDGAYQEKDAAPQERTTVLTDNNLSPLGYFIMTSSARWIKNNMRAVWAFDDLFTNNSRIAGNFKVVLTGVSNPLIFKKNIRNHDRFVLLDYIDRSDLASLEHHAYACIYPSLNEGFGYPPVEAMKYGVPVAASGTSSIPEVCGDAALYFDPYSVSEIKNRIIQLLDPSVAAEYRSRAVKQYRIVSDKQKKDLDALVQYLITPGDKSQ
jgi:glycosyltransferase involved in cell wall biosynthesis